MYTVKQVGEMSGVSVRTLHHYHAIGLLMPAHIGHNTYRYYDEVELLRLQQILFYKRLGFSLSKIVALLGHEGFDNLKALLTHRETLQTQLDTAGKLLATIDRTIARLQGHTTMKNEHLYEGFSSEKQSEHENWLVENGSQDMRERIEVSKTHNATKPPKNTKRDMDTLQTLETDMADCMKQSVAFDAPKMVDLLEQHRAWVANMWGRECSSEAYDGLADMYEAHPDFKTRYETIGQGFTKYLCSAMRAYAKAYKV